MKVEVLEIKDLGRGNLRCYATIQVGPLIIYRVRLIKQPGQKPYVTPPQFEWMPPSGRVQYFPVLKWPEEWKTAIFAAVWDAYESQREQPEGCTVPSDLFAGGDVTGQ